MSGEMASIALGTFASMVTKKDFAPGPPSFSFRAGLIFPGCSVFIDLPGFQAVLISSSHVAGVEIYRLHIQIFAPPGSQTAAQGIEIQIVAQQMEIREVSRNVISCIKYDPSSWRQPADQAWHIHLRSEQGSRNDVRIVLHLILPPQIKNDELAGEGLQQNRKFR